MLPPFYLGRRVSLETDLPGKQHRCATTRHRCHHRRDLHPRGWKECRWRGQQRLLRQQALDEGGTNLGDMVLLRKNERGFTLIELVLLIVIAGVLAAIVIPRYADLQERATKAEVKALLGSGRSAILVDFTDKVVNTGSYAFEPTDASTPGSVFDLSDVTDLENALQTTPRYPLQGRYDHPPNKGFRWYLLTQGSSSPVKPPVIDALLDITCDLSISAKSKKNDDCYVSKLKWRV